MSLVGLGITCETRLPGSRKRHQCSAFLSEKEKESVTTCTSKLYLYAWT